MAKRKAPAVRAAPVQETERVMLNGIDVTMPAFLIRKDVRKITNEEARELAHPTKRDWVMPNAYKTNVKTVAEFFVDDPSLPVVVNARRRAGQPVVKLEEHADFEAFKAAHDFEQYPVSRTATLEGTTIIVCTAKPWAALPGEPAGKPLVESKPKGTGSARSKVNLIGDLLSRPEGCTTADVLAATGWPSVSMPAQAKFAGLALRKEKVKGEPTRYWGTKL